MRTETLNPDLLKEDEILGISRLQLGQWEQALKGIGVLAEMLSDGHFSDSYLITLKDMLAAVEWDIHMALSAKFDKSLQSDHEFCNETRHEKLTA